MEYMDFFREPLKKYLKLHVICKHNGLSASAVEIDKFCSNNLRIVFINYMVVSLRMSIQRLFMFCSYL